jgi:hypothetical protein
MLHSALTRRTLVVVPFLLSSVIGLTAQKPPAQQPATVAGLRVERLETDAARRRSASTTRRRDSWILTSDRRNVMQTSARVLVASKPELAREGKADVWDSGSVTSADPWVVYGGPALKSATRYSGACACGREAIWQATGPSPRGSRRDCSLRATGTASGSPGPSGAAAQRRRGAADDAEIRAAGSSAVRWDG